MSKILKRLAAFALLGAVAVSTAGCAFGELEMPEWLEQATCDHVYDEEEVLREATCVQDGKVEKICSDCGATKIVIVKATGEHVWEDGVCTVCGEQEVQEICNHQNVELKGTDDVAVGTCYDCGVNLTELQYEGYDEDTFSSSINNDTWHRYDLNNEEGDYPLELCFDFEYEIPGLGTEGESCSLSIHDIDYEMYYKCDGEVKVRDENGDWEFIGEFSVATKALPRVFFCENYLYFYTGTDFMVEVDVEIEPHALGSSGKYNGTVDSWYSEYFDGLAKLVG